ncbi:hypothetical protein BHE74_00022384 [Ensete ventricosum]|nr:hypothetical protein BHE74_00022384 [Ensete ventricosum]
MTRALAVMPAMARHLARAIARSRHPIKVVANRSRLPMSSHLQGRCSQRQHLQAQRPWTGLRAKAPPAEAAPAHGGSACPYRQPPEGRGSSRQGTWVPSTRRRRRPAGKR